MSKQPSDAEIFEQAWFDFAPTVEDAVMNEATFQAWWAAHLTQYFHLRRVVREVDFNPRRSGSVHATQFGTRISLDVAIARDKDAQLPNRTWRKKLSMANGDTPRPWNEGWFDLHKLTVVSELKVGGSVMYGVSYRAVEQDYAKLSMVLDEASGHTPPLAAFMCILDNNPSKRINRNNIARRTQEMHPSIKTLWWPR